MGCLYRVAAPDSRWLRSWLAAAVLLCLASLPGNDRARVASPPVAAAEPGSAWEQVVCPVELVDPVFPAEPARRHRVVQFRDAKGFPAGYSLDIATEVCMDKKCRLVEVTMYWNAVGYFERLVCPPGKPLTKKEHVPFTAEDYSKLERILKDRDSILARQSLAFLAKPVEGVQGVDALSGATPLTVKESVVEDAAYTTWALWRWANGEIVPKLRGLTEQRCTPAYLQQLLHSSDRRDADFALKYVLAHHPSDAQFVDAVFPVLEQGDREHIGLSLRFLTSAAKDKEQLHARLIESYGRMKGMNSPLIVDYFAAQRDLPRATLEGLTAHLDGLPYFQVHLILRLLEQRKFFSPKTEADVARLLDGKDFFIARRASEYLLNHGLSREAKAKVAAFRERNRDRL